MDLHEQDAMVEIFIFESQQLLETLEDVLLSGEKEHMLNDEQINEVFRIMHTIKGSSAMMSFDNLARLSHAVEDLFAQIREKKARSADWDNIFDVVLTATDMIKTDIAKISAGQEPDSESAALIEKIHSYLDNITHRVPPAEGGGAASDPGLIPPDADEFLDDPDAAYYKIRLTFEDEAQMENMRAFGVVNTLNSRCVKIAHTPEDLMAEASAAEIVKNGFTVYIQSLENPDMLKQIVESTMFIKTVSLIPLMDDNDEIPVSIRPKKPDSVSADAGTPDVASSTAKQSATEVISKQNFISVNVNKLDKLMDLVGEIVTTESMVTKNPEVAKLQVESFERSGQQLRKLINELQDIVMSIRMVPVSITFHKMNRIVRDISKKVSKEVELVIIGEETEVDKNIIDHLSDPLMHLIRNAVDHGLEQPADRIKKGKSPSGKLTLEARSTGGDVMILVTDDGRGLNKSAIVKKAVEKGLTTKTEAEISDKDAYGMIFLPGFSTNKEVTEFSGRGVGMDVVRRNIDKVGGSISIDSEPDKGTSIQIRIPLTLAIIEGMKLRVGSLVFIVPMLSIQESFKPNMKDVFLDPDGHELIMIRGECYPIVRLHRLFDIEPEIEELSEGILIMIRTPNNAYCLFVDQLIGEQQAVIKPLPSYIQRHNQGMHGIGGCAILGDGSISLIIDINNLVLD